MKSLKWYNIMFIASIILGVINTLLMILKFTEVQYGEYTLYITYISFLGILSFGFQDGFLINYRMKKIEEIISKLKGDILFGILFQTIVFIISVIVAKYLGNNILMLGVLAIFPTILFGNIRSIYICTQNFTSLGILDYSPKIYLLITSILVILGKMTITEFILVDIFFRYIMAFITMIFIFIRPEKMIFSLNNIKNHFKIGLILLVGNWLIIVMSGIDKFFLRDDLYLLGEYGKAISIVMLSISMILPLKNIVFSKIDKNINISSLNNYIKILSILGMIIASLYSFVFYPLVKDIELLDSYKNALNICLILMALFPFLININIILNNMIILRHNSKYIKINIINLFIVIAIYIGIFYIFGRTLESISFATLLNFFSVYVINIFVLVDTKSLINHIIFILIWAILYFMSLINHVFIIGYIIYLVCVIINGWRAYEKNSNNSVL